MKIINLKNNKDTPYIVFLLGVFIVSRILYAQTGIRFLGDTYQYYWQFIHQSLLKTDLWRSIFYLHSQPPVLNVLTGIVLQMFPSHIQEAFHFLYYLAGALLAVSIYFLGIALGFPRWLSLLLTAAFAISPSTIFYENWLMYSYLIASALAFSGAVLYRFAKTNKTHWGILFFSLMAFVALTWTLFHIVWVFTIFVVVLCVFHNKKKVVMAALVPLLVVFGWYTKNLVVFGEFTAGTWGGMNLSHITTFRLPDKDYRRMIKSGELSKFAAYPPFRNPAVYLRLLPDTPVTGIPVLDITEFPDGDLNYNHQVYIDASKYYFQDALHVIRTRPAIYLRGIGQSFYIFFHSSSDFELFYGFHSPIQIFDFWWNRLFYGQWLNDESPGERGSKISLLHVGWWIVAAFTIGVLGNLRNMWKDPGSLFTPDGLLVIFMLLNVLYVTAVGNTMDIGENNRFRYVVDSFILLLVVRVIHLFVRSRHGKVTDKK